MIVILVLVNSTNYLINESEREQVLNIADTFYSALCMKSALMILKNMTKKRKKKDMTPTFQIELHEPNEALRLSKGEEINPLGSKDSKVERFLLLPADTHIRKLSTKVRKASMSFQQEHNFILCIQHKRISHSHIQGQVFSLLKYRDEQTNMFQTDLETKGDLL